VSSDHVETPVFEGGSAASIVVDEAVSVVDGIRSTARWIASSFGAIPSLAVLTSIVRAPGDAGFDPVKLALGVGLAALGAATGVLFFAWVIAPVPLEDDDVRKLDLRRVPGQPYATFEALERDLVSNRSAVTKKEEQVGQKQVAAKTAEARVVQYALAANRAELEAADMNADESLKQAARQARAEADTARTSAVAAATEAAAAIESLSLWTTQLERRYRIRQDAYRLAAADIVGRRYLMARIGAVVSVALVASGIVLLGLAPKTPARAGSTAAYHASIAMSRPPMERPH
jgi:hypothetical protein